MELDDLRRAVATGNWQQRLDAIRAIPHEFAGKDHQAAFASAASAFYAGQLAPHFHIVPWPRRFLDRASFNDAYAAAEQATAGFTQSSSREIVRAIIDDPRTLRIFRLIIGYTPRELSAALHYFTGSTLGASAIDGLEDGRSTSPRQRDALSDLAGVIAMIVEEGGYDISEELRDKGFLGKTDKPDTADGWSTVAKWSREGVPYAELLYQRWYGGAFRQLQDAGGSLKGELLEDATEELFARHGVPFVRTTPGTQATAGARFGIQVRPAPDFIVHDGQNARGLLECKSAGDGGTARDKAGRFHGLRTEANRIGGIAVMAVLDGLGWERLNDALGPVLRDCGGLVFSAANLSDMLALEPVSSLIGLDSRGA